MMVQLHFGYRQTNMRTVLFIVLFAIIATLVLLLTQSKPAPAPRPWDITLMADGETQVFGIHLGTTTYRQAQELLHQYGHAGIFTQEDSQPSIEAYFNSINLGGLSAKLVLNLAIDRIHINDMLSRAVEARLQPSGAHRYELSNQDNAVLINVPVIGITYIPSVRLNEEIIRHRFGQPDHIEQDSDNNATEIWHYPALGLTIRLTAGEKTILQYSQDHLVLL